MSQETKRISLLFLVGALISLILLSTSLSNLELRAGTPFPSADSHYSTQPTLSQEVPTSSFTVLQGVFGLVLLLLMVYVPLRVIALIKLKWLLQWLFRLILALAILFILLLIFSYINFGPVSLSEGLSNIGVLPLPNTPTSPLGRPPGEIIWLVVIGFSLLVGSFIIKIFRQQTQPSHMKDSLLQKAKNAIQELQAGKDFKNAIINCYLQMADVLQQERGIERSNNMTTREFQDYLEFYGLPCLPVQSLTDLFEKVRYGKQQLSESDEKMAVESLSEIICFAQSNKP